MNDVKAQLKAHGLDDLHIAAAEKAGINLSDLLAKLKQYALDHKQEIVTTIVSGILALLK